MRSFFCAATLALLLFDTATAADFSFTISANGMTSWVISSLSSPDIDGGGGPDNPTINLIVGKRYAVTSHGADIGHPFQLIAKGTLAIYDVVLLAEGTTVGSLESDSGINWTDDTSGNLQFTVTPGLITA